MKKNTILFLLVAMFWAGGIFAQKIIEPNVGYLNEIIKADVDGSGKQLNNVYILRRGATYYCNATIQNVGYPITIKAETGTGAIPKIVNWPDATGALQRIITAGDDVYLYNLFIDGMGPNLATTLPDPYYLMNGQLLNAAVAGKVLVADGCILLNAGQVIIRSNSGARKVQITNSVIGNSGQVSGDNIGNGRIIDFRAGVTDTVIFKNCTMVNTYDRIVRHYGAAANTATAFVKYIEFDHNTIVHNLGAYGYFFLGDISDQAKITNNLFYNPMTLGYEPIADPQRLAEIQNIGEKDATTGQFLFPLIIDQINTTATPKFTISNNVITYDSDVKKYFTDNKVEQNPVVSNRIAGFLGTGAVPATKADITLKRIPNNMINVMNWYHANAVKVLAGGMITDPKMDFDRRSRKFWTDSLDCSYTTALAAFNGTDKKPVGSNVWTSKVTAIKSELSQIPSEFSLSNNYPNPFNPSTKISFSLPVKSTVSLSVFNVLGQEVKKVVDQELSAGIHTVDFNATGLSSGMYVYTLKVVGDNGSNFVTSKKMTILK
jgi:hypothetical protein